MDLPPSQRFMRFDRIDWNRAFFKTYYEKRSIGHLIVNFNRIWVIHIAMYYFYTAFNSPTIYQPKGGPSSAAMTWSATALGGAVATVIMILATLAEFAYIPTTWNNTSHLTRRLIFLLVTLGLTCGPTFYIAIVVHNNTGGPLALILGIVQFFISVIATVLFAIMPSGRMFGDRVAGKSRKYLASQTFTASYPALDTMNRMGSIGLWLLVFSCKFTESYFYLTLSFSDPIRVMVGMKIQGCGDRFFGNVLCTNHAAFTLTIMYIMDLVLFFLDTFLWYIIWNTVISIARSFTLGLSIWTPWKDIYTRLPKRIYAKLLATGNMEVKYKPKVCLFFLSIYALSCLCANYRFWCRKFGTRSSFLCTENIFFPSTTSKNCYIIRWTLELVDDVVFVHLLSSFLKAKKGSRASSSHPAARRSEGFHSLLNL